jgi:hypothetical protein
MTNFKYILDEVFSFSKTTTLSLVFWHRLAIPTLGRLRQEDCEFKTSLGYTVRSCHKENPKN